MIDRGHELPLSRQAALLRLGRGSLYYAPRPVPAGELAVMRRMGIEAVYRVRIRQSPLQATRFTHICCVTC
jgi:hypothetical protein